MKKRRLFALVLALLMTMSLFACGKQDDTDDAEPTDTLVVLSSAAFQGSWDPAGHTISVNARLEWNVLARLLDYDTETGEYVPSMAESWEYLEDGYTLQMKLKQGIKFHDGSAFDAEDVKATIEWYTRAESTQRADWGCQYYAEVVDPYTVNIYPETKLPAACTVPMMATMGVISNEDVANGTLNATLNGTGPYKFVKYENETVYLERNEEYFDADGMAKMKYVEFRYVADAATRLAALQGGEAHLIERVESEQIAQIEADETIDYVVGNVNEQKYMIFKTTQAPMDNVLLRKAISYAIDRETIVNSIQEGYATLADSYVAHVDPNHVAVDLPTYDPEYAKQLLAEAGYPNGEGLPTLVYITSTGFYPKTKEYAEYIVQNLNAIGINVDLRVEEAATWEAHLYEEDSCHMVDTGWMNMRYETNSNVGVQYHTVGRLNFMSDPAVDALIEKETAETDVATRKDIFGKELYPLLVECNTNMPLFDSTMIYGFSKNLSGFKPLGTSHITFADLSVG